MTPGKVVARSDVAEIIQYEPTTETGAEAAAADLPALDQQVLHSRPQPGEILHPLGGGAGPHGLRHLLGQPDERHGDKGWEAYMREGVQFASTRGREDDRRNARSMPSAIASAARCWPRRWRWMAQEGDTASARRPSSRRRSTSPMPAT
jgi:hypothetical protein